MGSVSVSSCRCCMFVSCVHPVAVLNAAFCMTCSLLMLVEDAIGDHTEGLQTTQPTRGGAVTVVSSCCANCVEPPRSRMRFLSLLLLGLCVCVVLVVLW